MKILVYGDIGGHFLPLAKSLATHGVTLTKLGASIPKDVIVIQLGDLIDRGPMSDELVHAVDNTIYESNPRWIQMFGNHEANWVTKYPQFGGFDDDTNDETKATIRQWWQDKVAKMAVGVETEEGTFLITHAGLGVRKWDAIGTDTDILKTVRVLNGDNYLDAFAPGMRLGGDGTRKRPPGVAWASAVEEVYMPWVVAVREGSDIPFNQVHGHTAVHNWYKGQTSPWIKWCERECLGAKVGFGFEIDKKRRFTHTQIGDKSFWCIDQGLGRKGPDYFDIEPLVLEGEIVL